MAPQERRHRPTEAPALRGRVRLAFRLGPLERGRCRREIRGNELTGDVQLSHRPAERVQQGESVEFRFLAPTRGDHSGFVLEPATSVKVNAEETVQIMRQFVRDRLG